MGSDLVEQKQAGSIGVKLPGMGEGDRDQHGLLLTGRALACRLTLAGHRNRQFVAMRAGQRASRPAIASAPFAQGRGELAFIHRSARFIAQLGAGKGRIGQGGEGL